MSYKRLKVDKKVDVVFVSQSVSTNIKYIERPSLIVIVNIEN
jgi:hypothetical protein